MPNKCYSWIHFKLVIGAHSVNNAHGQKSPRMHLNWNSVSNFRVNRVHFLAIVQNSQMPYSLHLPKKKNTSFAETNCQSVNISMDVPQPSMSLEKLWVKIIFMLKSVCTKHESSLDCQIAVGRGPGGGHHLFAAPTCKYIASNHTHRYVITGVSCWKRLLSHSFQAMCAPSAVLLLSEMLVCGTTSLCTGYE